MSKKSFMYTKCDFRVVAQYSDNQWGNIELIEDEVIAMHEGSSVIHYGQGCFEGLKSYKVSENKLSIFRPKKNAERFQMSCNRLLIPAISKNMFLEGLEKLITSNKHFVPNKQDGSLYIRPFVFGIGEHLGVAPSEKYHFRIFCCPATSNYYNNRISLGIMNDDRAAKYGIGHVKAIGNYASGLHVTRSVKEQGFDDVLYLDSVEKKYIEETNTSNCLFVKDNTLFVPDSPSILKSITVDSIVELAKYNTMSVEQRPIDVNELHHFDECGVCGTAVTLIPVQKISNLLTNTDYQFNSHSKLLSLKQQLADIQTGNCDDPFNWNVYYSI